MSKLYFPKVYRYNVSENLLFISWQDAFECLDFIDNKPLFKIDHRFWYFTVINDKIFGQKDNGSDILVYDLTGKLVHRFSGTFYLWKNKPDGRFLFVYGSNEKEETLGFRIDTETLDIVDKIENYKPPAFLKGNLGFDWLANEVYCYDIFTNEKIWNYYLEDGITTDTQWCYLNNYYFILTTSDSRLIALSIGNGARIWQRETDLHYYTMHPVNKNLYGFGGSFFEVIESGLGDTIFSKEFPEIKEQFKGDFPSSCSEVREDGLYFVQMHGDKKFGKINIPGHELEFVMDIDIPQGNRLLAPSFPHRNCYFAIDYNNEDLHVYRYLKAK